MTTQQPQTPATADAEKKKKTPSEHLALWLTLVAIGFVAMRILIVSRGDSDTLRALVQNLNITAIVLATILPLAGTAIWLLYLAAVVGTYNSVKKNKVRNGKGNPVGAAVVVGFGLAIPTLAICWYAMPMKYIIFSVVLTVSFVAVIIGSRLGPIRGLFQFFGVILVLGVPVAGLFIVFTQVGVWLPRELLTVGKEQTGTVYVLSSDQEWTKYLDDQTHKVKIVSTKDVKKRDAISDEDTWLNKTPSEIVR
ncbi:hypothetical protein [Mycolicibacterium arseniciresistens]|uniref:Uncharacterized protein n=1 Tax=Mycolicibacterium arseniciresistens TaxID=3062257 RepID=A0ABT8UN82_9MYCO|nr:hypothetical protein [Mycolicibacterium arseniciresistens]MDO3637634.1 hypothetical protein [Mycolicibacterium arseniciresistens]